MIVHTIHPFLAVSSDVRLRFSNLLINGRTHACRIGWAAHGCEVVIRNGAWPGGRNVSFLNYKT